MRNSIQTAVKALPTRDRVRLAVATACAAAGLVAAPFSAGAAPAVPSQAASGAALAGASGQKQTADQAAKGRAAQEKAAKDKAARGAVDRRTGNGQAGGDRSDRSALNAPADTAQAVEAAKRAKAGQAEKAKAAAAARAAGNRATKAEAAKAKAAAAKKKAQARPAPTRGWTAPVTGYSLSAGFAQSGARWAHKHSGQDFAVPVGTPVRSVAAGTVVEAGWGGAYGNNVVVRHADGHYSQYAHLSRVSVSVGQKVGVSTRIALSGNTGNSTGPHLHFEIRNTPAYGSAVEPVSFLRAHGVRL